MADTRTTVLILGENGTGKTITARALHQLSSRREKPFVEVACGALTDTLLESELFGHVAGSFTGATQDKVGKFLQADGGTLFLDEIGTASPASGEAPPPSSRTGSSSRSAATRRTRSTSGSCWRRTRTSKSGSARRVPPGPLLPDQRHLRDAAPARERIDDIRCSCSTVQHINEQTGKRVKASTTSRCGSCSGTSGRGTSGNWSTWSSEAIVLAKDRVITANDLRGVLPRRDLQEPRYNGQRIGRRTSSRPS